MLCTDEIEQMLANFIDTTAIAWMDDGMITTSSYGVVWGVAEHDGSLEVFSTHGITHEAGSHDGDWYVENARGKALLSAEYRVDSQLALLMYPLLAMAEGYFPWGGSVFDNCTGMIVAVSGFDEDEDILMARTIMAWLIMTLNREGQKTINEARKRGEEGDGIDRFTRDDS